MAAIFELEEISKLPLLAQALIASRMARRAAFNLPEDFPEVDRSAMVSICDALDDVAQGGEFRDKKMKPMAASITRLRGGPAGEAAEALYWAFDAAGAAIGALDFPVDATCIRDVQNAIASASRAHGLSPLQVRIFAAADLDQLRFACGEANINIYDALGPNVMGRLAPVWPP